MAPPHAARARGRRVPSIIVHGGAGAAVTDADEFRPGMRAAVSAGWAVLAGGGRALDAVEAAVRSLEDDERFNAGRGAVLTEDGTVEMDASIMEGDRLGCGAVGVGERAGAGGGSGAVRWRAGGDSSLGGGSWTGDGGAIIRVVLARRALEYLKEADGPDYAGKVSVDLLVEEGRGEGGLIVVDWRGRIGYAHSTPLMPVGWMTPTLGEPALPF